MHSKSCSEVHHFGTILQVQALSTAPTSCGRLHWLDFASDLLTADGSQLNPNLHFDGTHMAPVYVQYLDRQLSAV